MTRLQFALVLSLALAPWWARAGGEGTTAGVALHDAHCTRCHATSIYTREQRLVNDLEQLRARVRQCELLAEAGWFDEEVEAVVAHLNSTYYRFPE